MHRLTTYRENGIVEGIFVDFLSHSRINPLAFSFTRKTDCLALIHVECRWKTICQGTDASSPSGEQTLQFLWNLFNWPILRLKRTRLFNNADCPLRSSSYHIKSEYVQDQLICPKCRIYASVNWFSLIQVMACRLIGTKPLPERMLGCC